MGAAEAPRSILSLDRVNKWHGTLHALREVSLEVAAGERLVICGPSGSGKSTLLRCINTLDEHQSGRIVVDGTEVTHLAAVRDRIRREVGMVFQSFNLFPHMTVLENCMLAPRWVRRAQRRECEAIARDYLARVHVENLADRYPSRLSGGQQQRVAIARALCLKPKILLFDEPTSALDPEMIKEVLDTISELAGSGMTLLCVTHEMGFARQLADRIVFMDLGEIVEQGPPAQIFDDPRTDRLKAFLRQILRGHAATSVAPQPMASGQDPKHP